METLDIYGVIDGRERVIIHNVRDSWILNCWMSTAE